MPTINEIAEEYSKRLRDVDPVDRKAETQAVLSEINRLTKAGRPFTKEEKDELVTLVEKAAEGKPVRFAKAHDMTSFHQAIQLLRQQIAQAK